MKKISLTAASVLLITAYSYCQSGKSNPQNVQITTVKGRGNALDTVIKRTAKPSINPIYHSGYKRNESVVQTLRPYLVSQIVAPGNNTHPVYLNRMREAKEKLPLAKAELQAFMKASEGVRKRLAKVEIFTEGDLNSVSYLPIPVYYVTPNIVFLKNGENVAKYYNLGRGGIKYLMLKNNTLIGYLDFYNNKSNFKSDFTQIRPFETESYNQVKKLGKTVIALQQGISTAPQLVGGGGSVSMFGYMDGGRLIVSNYEQNIRAYTGPEAEKPVFNKSYTLESADAFFSSDDQNSTIENWLKNTVKNLKMKH